MAACCRDSFYKTLITTLTVIALLFTVILTSVFVDIDGLCSSETGDHNRLDTVDSKTFFEDTEQRSKRSVESKRRSPKFKKYLTSRLLNLLDKLENDETKSETEAYLYTTPSTTEETKMVKFYDNPILEKEYLKQTIHTLLIEGMNKKVKDDKDLLKMAMNNILLDGIINHIDLYDIYHEIQNLVKDVDAKQNSDKIKAAEEVIKCVKLAKSEEPAMGDTAVKALTSTEKPKKNTTSSISQPKVYIKAIINISMDGMNQSTVDNDLSQEPLQIEFENPIITENYQVTTRPTTKTVERTSRLPKIADPRIELLIKQYYEQLANIKKTVDQVEKRGKRSVEITLDGYPPAPIKKEVDNMELNVDIGKNLDIGVVDEEKQKFIKTIQAALKEAAKSIRRKKKYLSHGNKKRRWHIKRRQQNPMSKRNQLQFALFPTLAGLAKFDDAKNNNQVLDGSKTANSEDITEIDTDAIQTSSEDRSEWTQHPISIIDNKNDVDLNHKDFTIYLRNYKDFGLALTVKQQNDIVEYGDIENFMNIINENFLNANQDTSPPEPPIRRSYRQRKVIKRQTQKSLNVNHLKTPYKSIDNNNIIDSNQAHYSYTSSKTRINTINIFSNSMGTVEDYIGMGNINSPSLAEATLGNDGQTVKDYTNEIEYVKNRRKRQISQIRIIPPPASQNNDQLFYLSEENTRSKVNSEIEVRNQPKEDDEYIPLDFESNYQSKSNPYMRLLNAHNSLISHYPHLFRPKEWNNEEKIDTDFKTPELQSSVQLEDPEITPQEPVAIQKQKTETVSSIFKMPEVLGSSNYKITIRLIPKTKNSSKTDREFYEPQTHLEINPFMDNAENNVTTFQDLARQYALPDFDQAVRPSPIVRHSVKVKSTESCNQNPYVTTQPYIYTRIKNQQEILKDLLSRHKNIIRAHLDDIEKENNRIFSIASGNGTFVEPKDQIASPAQLKPADDELINVSIPSSPPKILRLTREQLLRVLPEFYKDKLKTQAEHPTTEEVNRNPNAPLSPTSRISHLDQIVAANVNLTSAVLQRIDKNNDLLKILLISMNNRDKERLKETQKTPVSINNQPLAPKTVNAMELSVNNGNLDEKLVFASNNEPTTKRYIWDEMNGRYPTPDTPYIMEGIKVVKKVKL